MDYLHFNPIKHGLVAHVADWPYSSFYQHVKKNTYPVNGSNHVDNNSDMGEP